MVISKMLRLWLTISGKGEVGAGAEVQAPGREGAGAKTKTERRVKRGARVAKEREAAAENDTAVAPEAKTALGDTELARAPCR